MAQKEAKQSARSKMTLRVGFWAFIVALVLGVIGGIAAPDNGTITLILVLLGVIVGLLNISTKELLPFLVAAVALIVVGTAGFESLNNLIGGLGTTLDDIVRDFAKFMAPAAVIGAIRTLISVGFPG